MTSEFMPMKKALVPEEERQAKTEQGKLAMYAWWVVDGIQKGDSTPASIKAVKSWLGNVNKYYDDIVKSAKDGHEVDQRLLDTQIKIDGKTYTFKQLIAKLNTIVNDFAQGDVPYSGEFRDLIANGIRLCIVKEYRQRNEDHINDLNGNPSPSDQKQLRGWIAFDLGILKDINLWENSRTDIDPQIKITPNDFEDYAKDVMDRAGIKKS